MPINIAIKRKEKAKAQTFLELFFPAKILTVTIKKNKRK
jgi:hypothetical protein